MMRYKNMVTKQLEMAETLINVVITGMSNKTIDASDAYNKLKQSQYHIKEAQEKVSLEPDAGT